MHTDADPDNLGFQASHIWGWEFAGWEVFIGNLLTNPTVCPFR